MALTEEAFVAIHGEDAWNTLVVPRLQLGTCNGETAQIVHKEVIGPVLSLEGFKKRSLTVFKDRYGKRAYDEAVNASEILMEMTRLI